MDSDPNAPDILDDRSPPQGQAKPRERYNTNYIVDNFTRAERRNRMIFAGVAAALLGALMVGMMIHFSHHPPATPPAAGEPAAEGSAPAAPADQH